MRAGVVHSRCQLAVQYQAHAPDDGHREHRDPFCSTNDLFLLEARLLQLRIPKSASSKMPIQPFSLDPAYRQLEQRCSKRGRQTHAYHFAHVEM